MMDPTLIIRADAGLQMGTGHVMRCLALAEPWLAAGHRVILAAQQMPVALGERATKAGVIPHIIHGEAGGIEDAHETVSLVRQNPGAWVVVDGYQFEEPYQRVLEDAEVKFLLVDDFGHAPNYCSDFVLNQNLGVTSDWYPQCAPSTRLLLGTRYVQLRGEFLRQPVPDRTARTGVLHVLVTLGGSDPDNVTAKVIEALHHITAEVTVVVGGTNPHWESLQAVIPKQDIPFRLIRNADNMPELMARADFAIAAGGTTAWELAYMGLPMLIIVLADNQRSNAEQLAAAGVAENLGWHADLTPEKISDRIFMIGMKEHVTGAMSRKARELVDGLGSRRVALLLQGHPLSLRSATFEDCRLLWKWVNDPAVRSSAFNSATIPWENHQRWMAAQLQDPRCSIWIGLDETGKPVGQVRLEGPESEATIDVSVAPEERGKGHAPRLIRLAAAQLLDDPRWRSLLAWVKTENVASQRAFKRAGFHRMKEECLLGNPAVGYRFEK